MKKRTFFLSIFYSLGQISQGLFFHPYQTMQSLVRERVFAWMSFLPGLILCVGILLWKLLLVVAAESMMPVALEFLFFWLGIFCLYWQALLLYLLVRFWVGFR